MVWENFSVVEDFKSTRAKNPSQSHKCACIHKITMEVINLKAEKHLFLTLCPFYKGLVLILLNGLSSRNED